MRASFDSKPEADVETAWTSEIEHRAKEAMENRTMAHVPAHRRRPPAATAALYDDQPRTCRDFTLGSAHGVTARRRINLSP